MGASWAILEASWGHLSRLGGRLRPSWRPSWASVTILEAILGRLGGKFRNWAMDGASYGSCGGFATTSGQSFGILPGGRRDVPEAQGEFFWKKNQNQTPGVQHAVHPCDKSTGGGGSDGLRPIPPPCHVCWSGGSCMCYGISWLDSRGPRAGSFEASWGPFWGLSGSVPVMHVGYEGRA